MSQDRSAADSRGLIRRAGSKQQQLSGISEQGLNTPGLGQGSWKSLGLGDFGSFGGNKLCEMLGGNTGVVKWSRLLRQAWHRGAAFHCDQ